MPHPENPFQNDPALKERISRVKHTIMVLSGKGGVGKTTVAANLAVSLSLAGRQVGLLDIDLHGPSVPVILGLEGKVLEVSAQGLLPYQYSQNLKVMSIGFLIENEKEPVIWRGPMKFNVIRQFLTDVAWGDLDYLIIDSPPGTGDEPLAAAQLVHGADGALIVTTPQALSVADVEKSITFCHQVGLKVLGVIENMSGFVCAHCGKTTEIFKRGGGERLALEMNVPFLGWIPLDPAIVDASDSGKPYIQAFRESEAARAFEEIIRNIID